MLYPSSKYHGEQNDLHGGPLHWPGVNGVPFLGQAPPNLRQRELEQLPVVCYSFHYTFDLGDQAQGQIYQWIRDRIRNGLFTCDWVERHWDDKAKRMWIYIEWSQLYVTLPKNNFLGSTGNGSPKQFSLSGT
jgi:hypothetical protein